MKKSNVFLVTKQEFDKLENRNPIIETQIGFVNSKTELDMWIKQQHFKYHLGYYDKTTLYPRFILTKLNHL